MADIGRIIATAGQFSIRYGEAVLKDVSPATAARFAAPAGVVVKANHPVFVLGHLSIYSGRIAQMLEIPAPAATPAGWEELFKQGVECRDDTLGNIYPSLSAVSSHFFDGYQHVLNKLPDVADAVMLKPNPAGGRLTELLPTVGAAVTFLLTGHPMSHLGQISTWRRAMGLGSAL